jgi:hypothetical protein
MSIGGYGYGKHIRIGILQREERGYKEPKKLLVKNKELVLFPIKQIKQEFCARAQSLKKLINKKELMAPKEEEKQ